jgi:hypothetical protein
MPERRPSNDVQPRGTAARRCTMPDRSLPGFLLIALICCDAAVADDHALNLSAVPPAFAATRQSSPSATAAISYTGIFALPKDAGAQAFSPTEFRARKRSVFDRDPAPGEPADASVLESTTVWQRMSEYRSQDRVRLLTLWESSGGAISLQAGKRGDPSLQWNSRVMNHDGSTRGVFDRLLSMSFGGARNGPRSAPSPGSAPATLKPAANPVIAGLK